MKQITFIHIVLCVFIAVIFFIPAVFDIPMPILEELQLKSVDMRFKIRGGRKPSGNVVIAGIESKGIQTYGRWPWPRSVFAHLLARLKECGTKTIVFDLLFPEPEENRVAPAIESLAKSFTELNLLNDDFRTRIFLDEMTQIMEESNNDSLMAQAVTWSGNVILGMAFEPGKGKKNLSAGTAKALYQFDPVDLENKNRNGIRSFRTEQMLLPIKTLTNSAAAIGYVNIFPDLDGVIRNVTSTILKQDAPYMPLAVTAAGHFLDADPIWDANGSLKIADHKIEFDASGAVHLDFYGLENSFARFSIADIIEGRIPSAELKDKIVIIGGMATGLGDIWPTPLSSEIPGVLIQATFLDNILQNRVLKMPKNKIPIIFFTIFGMALLPLGLMVLFSPLVYVLVGIFFLTGYAAVTQYIFNVHQLIWPAVLPIGAGFFSTLVLLVYNFIIENRQHRWIKKSFSQYLSPDVIDILVRDPGQLKLGGEEKELTVMLADIRNFTSLSESLSPTDLTHLLNLYLGELTDVILDQGGTLDKYMGDAIMAFFGAPVYNAGNASDACRTAILMFERLHDKRKEWVHKGLPSLWIGIGINTGPMVVGNLGSVRRFDYSVIGDHVNLASRLEGLSKVYGVKMLISEYTRNHLDSEFTCRELDIVRVKGKEEPVRIYELLGKDYFTNGAYAFVDSFEQGIACYRDRSFRKAIRCFEDTLAIKPEDKPSQMFIQRCITLEKKTLPADWDGTWNFSQK
ncbi:CHASE2 domain-containing protein [Desulfobacula toluolica]|uniref:Adenylate cyclase with chase sensor domain n=1 Tax=Desulfobacula toluolica (strain DSM 7467 / Tol2) TaxID=651182 RepID=K0NGI2_DESTT|nr:adenylate/guanylate cyclase domain-containing protein [Desulfobacula toluolica]CCK78938.1 adenylate cyclase with chase sensor domain [Desulfobacula toluolica Tol2]